MLVTFLILFSSYIFISSGSLVSEKSGTANISIEGNAIMGAAFYILFFSYFGATNNSEILRMLAPMLSMIFATICTTVFSMFFALLTTKLYSDQIIAGSAINLLSPALSTFLLYVAFNSTTPKASNWGAKLSTTLVNDYEFLYPLIYLTMAILLVVFLFWLFKCSKTGLRLKAAGENPYALETSGISVSNLRMKSLILSGVLCGIGSSIWVYALPGGIFNSTVYGIGYMAIGIVIFGQWSVIGIIFGSAIIAFLSSLLTVFGQFNMSSSLYLSALIQSLPYITPIAILVILKSDAMPHSLGKPFKKDQR